MRRKWVWASIEDEEDEEDEDQTDPEIQATLEELKAEFDRIIIEEDKPNKD